VIASVIAFLQIIVRLLADLVGLFALSVRPRRSIEAENLFLCPELALFKERGIWPTRVDPATRLSVAFLWRLFHWRDALVVGRPRIPLELGQLIRHMADQNPLWGEARIANELLLKLELRVWPRTVRKYMTKRPPGPRGDQRWATFLRNDVKAIVVWAHVGVRPQLASRILARAH
jgi:hypothetical protein